MRLVSYPGYQCKACKKTFNAATGTALGLHNKGRCLTFGEVTTRYSNADQFANEQVYRMQELINYINDINHSLNDDSYVMNSVT